MRNEDGRYSRSCSSSVRFGIIFQESVRFGSSAFSKNRFEFGSDRFVFGLWFVGTDIHYAHFAHARLDGASFIEADLHGGNFYYASLRFTNFSNAAVGIAFLSLADLTGSNINETQLKYVASLNGAILPNGTRMTSRN